jgi:hypothetical protein
MSREHFRSSILSFVAYGYIMMPDNLWLSSTNRTRRKSCVSCTESKIKCDRQYPCSKCVARGRECMFGNSMRSKTLLAQSSSPASPAMTRIGSLVISQYPPDAIAHDMMTRMNSPPYPGSTNCPSQNHLLEEVQIADVLSASSGGYTSPIYATSDATLDYGSCAASDIETTTEADHLAPIYNHLSSVYPNNMFEPLFSNLFSQSTVTSTAALSEDVSWLGDPRSSSPEDFPFATSPLYRISADVPSVAVSYASPITQPAINGLQNLSLDSNVSRNEPAEPELEHYSESISFINPHTCPEKKCNQHTYFSLVS